MKLYIERAHAEALAASFPELARFHDQLRFGDKVEVEAFRLPRPALDMLHRLYAEAGPGMPVAAAQLQTLISALHGEGRRFGKADLEELLPAIVRHLMAHGTRGWLFTLQYTMRPLPYVITRLDYTPATNDDAGRIFMEVKANAKATVLTSVVRIGESDIEGKTVGEIPGRKRFPRRNSGADRGLQRHIRALLRMARAVRRSIQRRRNRLLRREPYGFAP